MKIRLVRGFGLYFWPSRGFLVFLRFSPLKLEIYRHRIIGKGRGE